MSKVFKLLYLIISITSIFCFIVFQFSNYALADQVTIDDSRITVTQNPDPARADSGQVTFTITAKDPILPTDNYTFILTNVDDKGCSDSRRFNSTNPSRIVITSTIIGCRTIPGDRKLELFYGGGAANGNPIVINYPFYLEQVGGGKAPKLIALNQNLALSEIPEVEIHNVKTGTYYLIWWEAFGNNELVKNYTPTFVGNSDKISLTDYRKGFPDPTKPDTKTLCMEAGNNQSTALGLTCRYKTTFNFTLLPSSPSGAQPSCSSNPQSPTANQGVSIKAINLPKNQTFHADLIIKDTTINLPQKQSSGDSGIISIPLAAFLANGNYGAKVYNTSTPDLVCEAKFTVGPTTAAVNPAGAIKQILITTPCGPGDNPGIATAIGCVHTSVVGFSKDVLKFVVGISGGLAFLMMLLGAFQMLTSAGNPETLQAGKDRFTSAIVGLLMIIFAVLLLKIVGFDILGLPGLG